MHTDAEAHRFAGRQVRCGFGERVLSCHCALHRLDCTGKIGDDAVAGTAEDASARGRDALAEDRATGRQPTQRADFVLLHQPAVAGDVGGEDRRQLADRFFFLAHAADKAEPFTVHGANEALRRPAVADRATRRVDPRAHVCFGNDSSVPYGSQQIVLADHLLAIADQVFEEVENLRLEGY